MTHRNIPYQIIGDNGQAGDYITDQGVGVKINKPFRAPSDIDDGKIDEILACVGAERRTELAPCPEAVNLKPRSLRFIRSNKNTFSLMIANRANILTAAGCIKTLLNSTDFPVVCIELIGEHNLNLIEELSPANKGAPAAGPYIAPAEALGRNVLWYSSVMKAYETDSGKTILMPFKTQTNVPDDAYSGLKTELVGCVGTLTTISCAGASSVDYRRYIPTVLTTLPGGGETNQTVTVPVKDKEAAQILDCGTKLATKTSVICLEYYGESNKKIHKFI